MIVRRAFAVAAVSLLGLAGAVPPAAGDGDTCAPRPGIDPRAPQYVCGLYDRFLHTPTTDEVDYWLGVLSPPPGLGVALEQVVQAFSVSQEANIHTVAGLYEQYLDRPADPQGLRAWADLLLPFATRIEQVETAVLGSGEYVAAAHDDAGFVAALYDDVLGRAASAGEVADWSGVLDNGTTHEAVAAAIVGSTERAARQAAELYELLGRTPSADEVAFWATQIRDRGFRLAEASFLGSAEAYAML